MLDDERRTQVYILRVWREAHGTSGHQLRATVRNLQSGETRYFHRWQELIAFVDSFGDSPANPFDDTRGNSHAGPE